MAQHFSLPANLATGAADQLRDTLLGLRGQPIELDGSAVERFGGMALQAVIAARRQWQADSHGFRLAHPSDAMRDALEVMGATNLISDEAANQ